MCGVMKSRSLAAAGACGSCARAVVGATATDATSVALASANRTKEVTRFIRARTRRDLIRSALEEQRFEQRREKKERDETEQRRARLKTKCFHNHERVNAKDDEAKNRSHAPPRHHVGLGR